ncbi:MAG: carbohydrate porin [bacterium]|nr:carbohydrate porin [bacterium]
MAITNGHTPGNRSRDQYTTEFYYRIQVLPSLVVTPDIQLIIDPSSNPDESVIAVFGLRARLAF